MPNRSTASASLLDPAEALEEGHILVTEEGALACALRRSGADRRGGGQADRRRQGNRFFERRARHLGIAVDRRQQVRRNADRRALERVWAWFDGWRRAKA